MKQITYILTGISLVIGLSACEMRDELKGKNALNDNEGLVSLDLLAQDYSNIITSRGAFPDEEVNVENYTVQIVNASTDGVVKETSYGDLRAEGGSVKLTAGKYRVRAYNYNGENVGASERPYFKGQTDFQILPGKTTTVNTTCRLSCVEVNLILAKSFEEYFKDDYTITITNGGAGNYVFKKENVGKKIYFNVPENASSILMSVKATTSTDGTDIAQSYTITKPENSENSSKLENGDSFKVTINPGDNPVIDPVTKINLGITVDLTWTETGTTVEIPTENIVFNPGGDSEGGDTNKGEMNVVGLDKTYSFVALSEDVPTVKVDFSVPNGIKKLLVRINSDNEGFMGTLEVFGLGGEFDLANPGDLLGVLSGSLETQEGIGLIDANDPIKDKTSYSFDVTSFMSLLGLYGASENTFTITVSDGINSDIQGDLKVNVTAQE
ncbi:DUF4493 domain-containing protein [Bacteroides faecichinchillae]|uniref:DUF4493 domain-containing protein n=1 Tax=Bacteroides faecichinchillae TaxID=871325 RepID=UPI0035173895